MCFLSNCNCPRSLTSQQQQHTWRFVCGRKAMRISAVRRNRSLASNEFPVQLCYSSAKRYYSVPLVVVVDAALCHKYKIGSVRFLIFPHRRTLLLCAVNTSTAVCVSHDCLFLRPYLSTSGMRKTIKNVRFSCFSCRDIDGSYGWLLKRACVHRDYSSNWYIITVVLRVNRKN